MWFKNKNLRYFYWLAREFSKKNIRLIVLSFFASFLIIASLTSFTPYLVSFIAPKHEVVGIAGEYTIDNLPNEILGKVSQGLIALNESGDTQPALSTSWSSKNGQEFTFKLKKNLFWDDGKPFTAHDIDYRFRDVEVKALDNYTVQFKLKKPLAVFPIYLAQPVIKETLHGVVGLYRVSKIKSKYGVVDEIVLTANRDKLPVLTYRFYDSESELINAYKKGEITQMTITKKSLADRFTNWKNSTITKSVDYSKALALFFNLRNKALQEKEVRQAIAASIDKSKFAQLGEIAEGPVPPTSWAYNATLKRSAYNPEFAKNTFGGNEATLAATLNFKTYYDYLNTATEINDYFEGAGLKTNLTVASSQVNDFDLLLTFWTLGTDPDQYYFWHSTQLQSNITGYNNVKVDKLLEDGRGTMNKEQRRKQYFEFQRILADDPPAVFLYYPYTYTIKRK